MNLESVVQGSTVRLYDHVHMVPLEAGSRFNRHQVPTQEDSEKKGREIDSFLHTYNFHSGIVILEGAKEISIGVCRNVHIDGISRRGVDQVSDLMKARRNPVLTTDGSADLTRRIFCTTGIPTFLSVERGA